MTARQLIVLLILAACAATAALSQRSATPTGQPAADTEVPRKTSDWLEVDANSNTVGSSTGKSTGLAPQRIRFTYSAH